MADDFTKEHCWHEYEENYAELQEYFYKHNVMPVLKPRCICCYCGKRGKTTSIYEALPGHGPHAPKKFTGNKVLPVDNSGVVCYHR